MVRRTPVDISGLMEAGLAAYRANRLDEAEAAGRSVLDAEPGNSEAHNLLGLVSRRRGARAFAVQCFERAIALDESQPAYRANLAGLLAAQGDLAGAEHAYAAAVRLQPDSPGANFNHGLALNWLHRYAEALARFRIALRLQPDFVPAWTQLAATLISLGRPAEAEEAASRAIAIRSDFQNAWINLGRAQFEQDRLTAAERSSRQALKLHPPQALAAYNLGCALQNQWRYAEAAEAFRMATRLDPGHRQAWSNRLMVALYDPAQTEQTIYAASREWARSVAPAKAGQNPGIPLQSPDTARRRLRIGYVSPDFRRHSCASFLRPLFAAHDKSEVEIFAYANVGKEDEVTQWFRGHVDHWRDIRRMPEAEAAAKIRADRLDILVDLAGHTESSPIGIFQFKPAPVQVSWLGYPATTGLEQIDFRLTDAVADPEGAADAFHVEKLVRLSGGFLCYAPHREAPEISALPAVKNGQVTFGAFNSIAKITPAAVAAWSRILREVPGSRLIIRGWMLKYAETRARVLDAFAGQGIETQRLDLQGWVQAGKHLESYHQVDIGLDTFPYNGTTTTFESLWMGVPVVTLLGERHAGRVGASIMTHLGRPEWIAADVDQYVGLACRLAENTSSLTRIRANLRALLQQSSLCDEQGFARRMESVFRQMVAGGRV